MPHAAHIGSRRAMTIVDVAVTVGSATMLIGVVSATAGALRPASGTAVSMANCMQLGAAHALYAMDHNGLQWCTHKTEFGLTAAVFTEDLRTAWRYAEELCHGTVHINETTNYWDQMAPFGGAKKSGAGRELSTYILDAMSETKQITWDIA